MTAALSEPRRQMDMGQKGQLVGNSDGQSTRANSSARESAEANMAEKQSNGGTTATPYAVLPRMSDPNPSYGPGSAASQPMSKSNSAGSNPSSKDAGAGTGASPYGTRSRNRTGTSRPNYAEDKDIDMEFYEGPGERREDETKKPLRQGTASLGVPQDTPRTSNGTARKPLPSDSKHGSSQHHPKEQPSTTTTAIPAATAPNPQTSKKRKAASQVTSGNGAATTAPSHATANTASRRNGAAVQGGRGYAETNMLTFETCGGQPKDGKMIADDGTVLSVNDHVYLVCEPPGEPYYLARVMEFLHQKSDAAKPVDAIRVNWYYRPRDIARKVQDTRSVFATMHSDITPLTALRGKCQIKHKAEIKDLDKYRKTPDCFWFEKLYDRYIQKNYEVIPTFQIVNVPERVKKVLDDRWKYILVEQGRGKELTSAVKSCKRCSGYCASNDSVDCAVCKMTYHMNCVKPPLLKKPSRGFAWSCAQCSRLQERKLEARNTPNVHDPNHEAEEEEFLEEEEEDLGADTARTSPANGETDAHPAATAEQIYHASLWPYRYLGIHCKVEDALDYDDRIYPRAATRVGPRHQANVLGWPGRPVEYVKPLEIKKSGRKDARLSKEQQAMVEADRIARETRPKWIQDQPPGYVARGEDLDEEDPNSTATLLYKTPDNAKDEDLEKIDEYMRWAQKTAKSLDLPNRSTNLQDVASNVLFINNFNIEKGMLVLPLVQSEVFKEPRLSLAEQKKFDEAIAKYGSELHNVTKHVKIPFCDVVRYYYTWKKTDRGKQIWGNYSGRKMKKEAKEAKKVEAAAASKLQDDVADDADDSAFDTGKAVDKKRQFTCKFCTTKESRQWRRAPNASASLVTENGTKNGSKDKGNQYVVALCRRCAELWRRYAVQWEDVEVLAQKVASSGGRAWKKKIDEELLKELAAGDDMMRMTVYTEPAHQASAAANSQHAGQEPPRKKLKGAPGPDKELEPNASDSGMSAIAQPKKKEKAAEKPAPPPVPEMPKPRTLPCAICLQLEPLGDQHLSCRECRLAVHRNCYGVIDNRNPGKWVCDMCSNDKNPQISIQYKCVLCPVEHTEHDFVEPPKVSHKKKTEKERERERQERETAQKAADFYRKRQEEMNRPVNPREPLKRTADNNWVHVTCAVWTPEVKFGNAKALEPSESIPSIPRSRFAEVCKLCQQTGGACVACHHCKASVHVECAHKAGFLLGFDITPVKGSRRDQFNIITINGESGTMSAAVWCKEHIPNKTIVHRMQDAVDESGMNALQLYVQNFKQADLTLTGCARKANLISLAAKMSSVPPLPPLNRRSSTIPPNSVPLGQVNGDHRDESPEVLQPGGKICLTCGVDTSPKWHAIDEAQERELMNGYYGSLGAEAQKFIAQRNFQCHKCRKAGKQPKPHGTTKETTPEPEPVRAAPQPQPAPAPAPVAPSPPAAVAHAVVAEARAASVNPYSWGAAATAPTPHQQAPPMQAAPPPPPPQVVQPVVAPPSHTPGMSFRATTSNSYHQPAPLLPLTSRQGYDEWLRPTHHSPPTRPAMNGASHAGPAMMAPNTMPPLAPPNHLRPPPIGAGTHPPPPPPPPPMQNGHMGPAMMNGMPPSPRRSNGPPPPMTGGSPYNHPYHHNVHHGSQHMSNGGPPPRAPEPHPFTQVLNQRSYSSVHGGPPPLREPPPGIRIGRDLTREHARDHAPSYHPPRPSDPRNQPRPNERNPNGASSSPSLHNLLL